MRRKLALMMIVFVSRHIGLAKIQLTHPAAATKKGAIYLQEGARAEHNLDYATAVQLYDYALAEDPHDAGYWVAQSVRTNALLDARALRRLINRRLGIFICNRHVCPPALHHAWK